MTSVGSDEAEAKVCGHEVARYATDMSGDGFSRT